MYSSQSLSFSLSVYVMSCMVRYSLFNREQQRERAGEGTQEIDREQERGTENREREKWRNGERERGREGERGGFF